MYVLNAGPSEWSAFHVIGTVFDRAVTDNGVAHDVQTVNLALEGGRGADATVKPLPTPASYQTVPELPHRAVNVAEVYARLAADLREGASLSADCEHADSRR